MAGIPFPSIAMADENQTSETAPESKPLETGGSGKATVRTRYPVDRFEHNVKGVDPITSAGTEVDRSKVKDLLSAAEETGTELEEVENA